MLYRYKLIVISFLALRYRSRCQPVFLAKPLMKPIYVILHGYKLFYVGWFSNIDIFLVFSSLVFKFFLMHRADMCFSLYDSVSIFSLCNMWGASEGMRKLGVHEVSVVEPQNKKNAYLYSSPTTTQVATIGIYNSNHFATNSLLTLYKIMIEFIILNLFGSFFYLI